MNETPEKTPKKRDHETVLITRECNELLESHINQIKNSKKGVRPTRGGYLLWRFKKLPKMLTTQELDELTSLFYDEERFLKEMLREIRSAKARGEKLAPKDYLELSAVNRKPRKRRVKIDSQLAQNPLPTLVADAQSGPQAKDQRMESDTMIFGYE